MHTYGWVQLALYLGVLALLTKPLGVYLTRVLDAQGRTFLHPVLGWLERLVYRLCRIDPAKEHGWAGYTVALLLFSLAGMVFTYAILRLQYYLPLNPKEFTGVPDGLALNVAASFTTNTNWQNYGGESTLSYFSQMAGLAFHNFMSAAAGIAVAAALVRGIARHSAKTIGNFWVDLVRINLYLLLPLSTVIALVLVSQGMIQNFSPYADAKVVQPWTIQVPKMEKDADGQDVKVQAPKKDEKGQEVTDAQGQTVMEDVMVDQAVDSQSIVQGPMASQVAIKMLGTNGGGYVNANASHPYENPTPFSNFVQMLAIFLIPSALTYYLGRTVGNQQHGWAVWSAMAALFLAGALACWWAEAAGNPHMHAAGVSVASGNMEGKEVRFGIASSTLFATITTDASCGAVNSMHDSYTPLGGMVPMVNMKLGEVVFGGVGAGLYGMLIFVVMAIFISGLMIGRTPEYLGKKIEAYDMKVAVLFVLIFGICVLGFTAWAVSTEWGLASLNNKGPHGFSEILYAFTSMPANNGSAFAGLNCNLDAHPYWYNLTGAAAMLLGRFFMIIPALALAGNLARKKRMATSVGSFPVSGLTFTLLVIGTIVIVGALTFLPALALGPIVEHYIMHAGTTLY